jgi:SAM-dependent methyltransferase
VRDELTDWDERYGRLGRRWGERPSVLAEAAVRTLDQSGMGPPLRVLDLGCGYGRDAFHLRERCGAVVLGVDGSAAAVALAETALEERRARGDAAAQGVAFRQATLAELAAGTPSLGRFDVVFAANLYQVLEPAGRRALVAAVDRLLRPAGLLFVSTLSIRDPEHYGKGVAVPGDVRSFRGATYLHFATAAELRAAFPFIRVSELYELDHLEPQEDGPPHRHISWLLIAERVDGDGPAPASTKA